MKSHVMQGRMFTTQVFMVSMKNILKSVSYSKLEQVVREIIMTQTMEHIRLFHITLKQKV